MLNGLYLVLFLSELLKGFLEVTDTKAGLLKGFLKVLSCLGLTEIQSHRSKIFSHLKMGQWPCPIALKTTGQAAPPNGTAQVERVARNYGVQTLVSAMGCSWLAGGGAVRCALVCLVWFFQIGISFEFLLIFLVSVFAGLRRFVLSLGAVVWILGRLGEMLSGASCFLFWLPLDEKRPGSFRPCHVRRHWQRHLVDGRVSWPKVASPQSRKIQKKQLKFLLLSDLKKDFFKTFNCCSFRMVLERFCCLWMARKNH